MPETLLPEFRTGGLKTRLLSLISRYYRGKASISKAGIPTQAVLPFSTVSRDKRIALIKNSKAGCTSLTHAIYTYDTGTSFKGNIHREGHHLRQGYSYWQSNLATIKSGESLVVSAIRNPYDRLVSAYFDFVVEQRNPMRKFHVQSFQAAGLANITDLADGFDIFLDYVENAILTDPWLSDRHWRPQCLNLWVDEISYDLVMRTDSLSAGANSLRQLLDIAESRFPMPHSNKTKRESPLVLNGKQKLRIEHLYASDFELFERNPV